MANHNHKSSRQSISDAVHTALAGDIRSAQKGRCLNRVLPSAATITPVDSKDVSKVLVSGHPPAHSTSLAQQDITQVSQNSAHTLKRATAFGHSTRPITPINRFLKTPIHSTVNSNSTQESVNAFTTVKQ